VANTGRCGSKFMASVFGHLTNIPSFHENQPYCIGQVSKEINNNCVSDKTQRVIDSKIAKIKCHDSYFESNNMFIKSFVWPLLDAIDDMYVIYLHRNPHDTFLSHGERNWKKGLDWFLQPHWERNFMRSIEKMSLLDTIDWNWHEVRERFLRLKKHFVKTYDFDFRKINDLDEYYKLFDHFGIEHKKVDALPEFNRNENTEGRSVTDRYLDVIADLNTKWDEPGIEWVFQQDV
jgi:hypothetical protein